MTFAVQQWWRGYHIVAASRDARPPLPAALVNQLMFCDGDFGGGGGVGGYRVPVCVSASVG